MTIFTQKSSALRLRQHGGNYSRATNRGGNHELDFKPNLLLNSVFQINAMAAIFVSYTQNWFSRAKTVIANYKACDGVTLSSYDNGSLFWGRRKFGRATYEIFGAPARALSANLTAAIT